MPFDGCLDDGLSDVTYSDGRLHIESSFTQLVPNSLQQCKSRLLLVFQLWRITLRHLWRSHRFNRLQHVQNQNLGILSSKLCDNATHQGFGELRIVNSHQNLHGSSFLASNQARNQARGHGSILGLFVRITQKALRPGL